MPRYASSKGVVSWGYRPDRPFQGLMPPGLRGAQPAHLLFSKQECWVKSPHAREAEEVRQTDGISRKGRGKSCPHTYWFPKSILRRPRLQFGPSSWFQDLVPAFVPRGDSAPPSRSLQEVPFSLTKGPQPGLPTIKGKQKCGKMKEESRKNVIRIHSFSEEC